MNQDSNDAEIITKILEFLKRKPHFFDESNPLFYDAFQKISEKKELAKSFEPPLDLLTVSAKIRYITHRVIDDFYFIKKGKKPKWQYFEEAKFMLPALMTKLKPLSKNISFDDDNDHLSDDEEDIIKKLPRRSRKSETVYCKICNFTSPTNLYSSHFDLYHHKKGEINWKIRKDVESIQCPNCNVLYTTWFEFLNHLENDHLLNKEDINYKIFNVKEKILMIDMNSSKTEKNCHTAEVFYER